jgi:hypothetical protein
MRDEGQTDFHIVAMFALYGSILLMCMRTEHMMNNANIGEGVKLSVFASPIGLNDKNFAMKLSLNKDLKILKLLKHFRFKFNEINPCEFNEIIHKTNIIFISPY